MPLVLGCFALFAPRLIIFLVWVFSDYLAQAYQTAIWPVLGFIFMPLTTLAYAWAMNANDGALTGGYLFVFVGAILVDLGIVGGGYRYRRRKVVVER